MKTIITKYVCVSALVVSLLIPSSVGAYTQADIDAMFSTVQSLLAQIAQLIADRNNVAEVSTGACTISVFATEKSSINSGSSTVLYWEAGSICTGGKLKGGRFGAEGISVNRTGERSTETLTQSTTYTLSFGSVSKTVTVAVVSKDTPSPLPTITLSTSPTSITAGQSSTLTWSSTNATSCIASNGWTGTKTTSGTQSVSPTANTNYTLTCSGTGGSATQSVTVSVNTVTTPVPTVTFSASPASIGAGQSATLTWSSSDTTSCTASGGWSGTKTTSGSESVSPTANTNYTLTCSGNGGSANQSATVSVTSAPAPTITLSTSPTSITAGQSSTLTWSSTNATSCIASNGWTGTKTTSGTQSVSPTANTNYTLTCSGTGGSATQSVTVNVGTVTPPPPPAGGAVLTPSALLPAYGPLIAKKSTSVIPELATFDSRFLQYEKKHYDNYIANTSGTPAVGYNHYGFLGSRLNYAIRNGLPYGSGVTNEATDMYARGRRVTLDWLSTYAVPNNYAVAQWQNTALEDLEALVVLENNPTARTQIHIDAARGTDDKPYMKMQASGADPRGITIFLQPMLIAHRLGIPYVHPGNGYSGTFDKTLGSWSNAAKRNIYWLDQYNVIQSDGTIISNAHKGAEAYFMSAMLVNQLIGYYGYIDRDPKVFSMIQRSVDHWINVLPAGWDTLPYQSITTSTGSNTSPAEDLAGFFVYPSLVMWQETGNQKYYDFAIKNIRAANKAWVAGFKQFNQVYNTDAFSAEALISGVHWKPAKPPYPPTGTVTPPPTNTPSITFSANPTSVTAGSASTLTWSSTNTTSCTASNGWTGTKTTSGTQSVSPIATTTYTLTCTGTGGSATQSVTVSVGTVTPPPTQKFIVGDTVQTTANLNVRGTAGGTILGQQPLGALGKVLAGPVVAGDGVWWNIDYANAPDGWSFEGFLVKSTVIPPPPATPTITFSANPTSVTAGSASTLTWSSTNTTSCTASNGWTGTKTTSGTQSVSPTANTNYTLTCSGNGGSVNQSVSVNVSSSNSKFIIGDSVQTTANLNVRGTAGGTILGQQALGSVGKVVGGPTTVQLGNEMSTWWNIDYANTPDGWSFEPYLMKSTVAPPPGTPTITFSANPTSVTAGSASTLTWSSTNTTSCTASNGWTGTKTTSGTQSVSPIATTTYTLTCTGTGGSATQSVTVSVGTVTVPTTPTLSFSPNPTSITAGQSSTLTWSSTNTTSCTASNGWTGTKTTSGTQNVSPTVTTTYTLTCSGPNGNVTKNATVTLGTGQPPLGPVLPTLPQVYVDTTMPVQTGKTIPVSAGGDFQKALNQALPGDTIVLEAGATFTGNFTLPNKNSTGQWIVITSSKLSNLPSPGKRVFPKDAVNMPKIVSKNPMRAITAGQGASHYRFIGVEITDDGIASQYGPTLPSGGKGGFSYGLIDLGTTGRDTQLSHMPHHIIFDRSYIHGQPNSHIKFGVSLNGAHLAVIDSYLSEFHGVGQDTQAINGYNGSGPFKIVNNHLEGAGENIIFGGADPSIPGVITRDVEIRGNYFYKPTSWMINDPANPFKPNPNYIGIRWLVKNSFELKQGERFLVEGNIFKNNWADGQTGFPILIKMSNQGGGQAGAHLTTRDITFRYNIIDGAPQGANLSGVSAPPGVKTDRYLLEHNVWLDIDARKWTNYSSAGCCAGLAQVLSVADNTIFRNNTGLQNGGNFLSTGGNASAGVFISDNIANYGPYGISGTVSTSLPGAVISHNVIVGKALSTTAYPGNFNAGTAGGVGFVGGANPVTVADFALSPTSPFKGKASNGGDPGADIGKVLTATQYAVSGAGQPPIVYSNPNNYLASVSQRPVVLGVSSGNFYRNLGKGVSGDDVVLLQNTLRSLGFFAEESTGYFGSVTEKAVQDLQIQYGIVTGGAPETTGFGVVGPKTQQKLLELQN